MIRLFKPKFRMSPEERERYDMIEKYYREHPEEAAANIANMDLTPTSWSDFSRATSVMDEEASENQKSFFFQGLEKFWNFASAAGPPDGSPDRDEPSSSSSSAPAAVTSRG